MRYPDFDGHEPCASIGTDFYYVEDSSRAEVRTAKAACLSCHTRTACLEWALHHEGHGVWGGLTERERRDVRRRRNIILVDPVTMFGNVAGDRRCRDARSESGAGSHDSVA